jgi:hypothetical protein
VACASAWVLKSPHVFVGQSDFVSAESEQEIASAIMTISENRSVVIFLCFMVDIILDDKLKML